MSADDWRAMASLALAWVAYGALHSALAALGAKRWVARQWPAALPAYRLAFNGIALLTLLPIGWLAASHRGPQLWAWSGATAWLANALALAAFGVFVLTLRHYDGQEFLGWRQWVSRAAPRPAGDDGIADREVFHLSPFHRYVRHPWYCLSLIVIWTRDMDAATLVSALMISAYFVIGARLEEAKLLLYHGDVYRRYMARVSGLVVLPWKTLSAEEAAQLEVQALQARRARR